MELSPIVQAAAQAAATSATTHLFNRAVKKRLFSPSPMETRVKDAYTQLEHGGTDKRGVNKRSKWRQVIKSMVFDKVYACRRMGNLFATTAGASRGSVDICQISSGTDILMPCYLMDLTMLGRNNITVNTRNNMKRMFIDASGRVQWNDNFRWMVPSTGAQSHLTWHQELPIFTDTEYNSMEEQSYLDWTDIRFVFYGAKKRPISFIVELLKIYDEDLDPWAISWNPVMQGYWQGQVRHLTFNPQGAFPSEFKERVKVLHKKVIDIQPTSTTENDTDPHVETYSMFNRWCRTLDYTEDSIQLAQSNMNNANLQPSGTGEVNRTNTDHVNTRSKIFLCIRATDYSGPWDGTGNINELRGSFDIVVRRKDLSF